MNKREGERALPFKTKSTFIQNAIERLIQKRQKGERWREKERDGGLGSIQTRRFSDQAQAGTLKHHTEKEAALSFHPPTPTPTPCNKPPRSLRA